MRQEAVTLKPPATVLSRSGRVLGLLALPWCFAILVGVDFLFEAAGQPRSPDTPLILRVLVVALALAPGAIWAASRWLGRVKGFRWLLAWPQPLARIDAEGIDLTLPRLGTRRVEWDHVAGLVPRRRLQERARLIGLDGATLVEIPESLVYPYPVKGPSQTLAQVVVETRPDRYALSTSDWRGLPDGFALREIVRGFDPRVAEKRRTALLSITVLILAASTVGAIALFLLAQGG